MSCGHDIWIKGGFVIQFSGDAGISVWRTVWVTANRCCMIVIIIIIIIIIVTPSLCILGTFNSLDNSLTLREERKLRVFENKVLRGIFGPRRDEVTGDWRRLHNEELNDLYCSPHIVRVIKSRRMRWDGHVARMGEERGLCRVLVGKPEGKRPLGRPRRRWVDNIKMDLQEVGCGYMDWIGLAQDRDRWLTLMSAVMNLRVPWNAGNFLTSCKPVSCSGRTLHHGVSKY